MTSTDISASEVIENGRFFFFISLSHVGSNFRNRSCLRLGAKAKTHFKNRTYDSAYSVLLSYFISYVMYTLPKARFCVPEAGVEATGFVLNYSLQQ